MRTPPTRSHGHIRTENLASNPIGRKDLWSVTKIPQGRLSKRSQSDARLDLPLRPLAELAQNEEGRCGGREAGKPRKTGAETNGGEEKTRTHFTFRIDTWSANGESIIEHVAGVEDYHIALATYRAACERWPSTPITLCQVPSGGQENSSFRVRAAKNPAEPD
jgi:hypothetical protein